MNLLFSPLGDQINAIFKGEISSRELIQAHLDHIHKINPYINAAVQIPAERALLQAIAADEKQVHGESLGKLHGIPFSVKDSIETAGVITASGTLGRANHIPNQSATIVQRLEAEGAILIAKSNCPELALPFETDNLLYGRTNNPYNLDRTAGGSTGGGGALVAAGGSPLELTVDAAASIRMPAHFCGITGIKPTTGRIPRTGHFPPIGGAFAYLSAAGPMTRFVDDLDIILPILCGGDGYDPYCVPVPLRDSEKVDISQLKIAVHTDNGYMLADSETAQAVHSMADVLSNLGAQVDEILPPVEGSVEMLFPLFGADGGERLRGLLARLGTKEISPYVQMMIDRQADHQLSVSQLFSLLGRWDGYKSAMMRFMQDYDVILCPVCATPAPPHGTLVTEEGAKAVSYTIVFNLAGLPCSSVPVTFSIVGLPIGVQVVAAHWREDIVLAVSKAIEAHTGGYRPPAISLF